MNCSYNINPKRRRKLKSNQLLLGSDYVNNGDSQEEFYSESTTSSSSTTPLYERRSSYDILVGDDIPEIPSEFLLSTEKPLTTRVDWRQSDNFGDDSLDGDLGLDPDLMLDSDKPFTTGMNSRKKEKFVDDEDNDTFCVDMCRFKTFKHQTSTNLPSTTSLFSFYDNDPMTSPIKPDWKTISPSFSSASKLKNNSSGGRTRPIANTTSKNFSNHSLSTNYKLGSHNSHSQVGVSKARGSKSSNTSNQSHVNNATNSANISNSQVYKAHSHRSGVPASLVPCKGPACRQQICCAQFCSLQCFNKQSLPIGSGLNYKTSINDYDVVNNGQSDIHVTDYGLFYPDHTYCKDHKNVYFTTDYSIDEPPYCELVEQVFYNEKETRIKNPRPAGNALGDPIPATGYVAQAKRGRPRRSHLSGLLEPYVYHPSSDVKYTPFIFKEPIIDADKRYRESGKKDPVEYAIRTCTNLYKETRRDIPPHILSSNCSSINNNVFEDAPNAQLDMFPHSHPQFDNNIMLDHHQVPAIMNHQLHEDDSMLDSRFYDFSIIKTESVAEINTSLDPSMHTSFPVSQIDDNPDADYYSISRNFCL